MVREDLLEYIERCRAEHISAAEIRKTLREIGWPGTTIAEALKKTLETDVKEERTTVLFHSVFYTVAILLVCSFGALSYYLYDRQVDLEDTNKAAVQEFYSRLAHARVTFDAAGTMIFPDEQRFIETRDAYVREQQSFIEADLRAMHLTLYEDGVASSSVEILTKGKERSWWETPTGDYSVLGKSPSAYSTIGNVWMPYSIQFYGNYFIHGWPYYEDGTPVPQGYSGGCIRLSTDDARTVFNFASVGMPILVLESEDTSLLSTELPVPDAVPPATKAGSFLVVNLGTEETILEKNMDSQVPIASLTKLMTALVAHETIYLGRSIYVAGNMTASVIEAFDPDAGSRYVGIDLLYPLLMQSSNETADAIAASVGTEQFVANMNRKAKSIGMAETAFVDPSGKGDGNRSTAKDLSKLLQYIYFKRPFIFDITKGIAVDHVGLINVGGTVAIRDLTNYNEFVTDPDIVGVKNGMTTAAKETMVSVWNVGTGDGVVPVGIIVLGSEDRAADTDALIRWLRSGRSDSMASR